MARNNQLTRVLKLKEILENQRIGLTAKQLNQALGQRGFHCSIKTIQRDLDALSAAGIPVVEEEDSGENGATVWWIEKSKSHFAGGKSESLAHIQNE